MTITATELLTQIPLSLNVLYPTIPVIVRKGEPGPNPASNLAGWKPGDPSTCFVVSCEGPEDVDEGYGAGFRQIFVRYYVQIAFVKAGSATPGQYEEDPEVREKRQTIRDYLYQPTYPPVPSVWDIRVKCSEVYQVMNSDPIRFASPVWFSFLSQEQRQYTPA